MSKGLVPISFLIVAAGLASSSLIDRWASAVGGRDKITAIKSIYREASIQVGVYEGTIKVWHTADGRYRKEEQIATLSNNEAFDGVHGTIQQNALPARTMTDAELAMTRSRRFSNWNAILFVLFPERHHGTIRVDGEQTLSFQPDGGVEWQIDFDPHTSLPKTMTHKEGDRMIKVEFVSYETVDGIQFEKEIHRSGANPQMNATIRFTKTVINPSIDDSLFIIR